MRRTVQYERIAAEIHASQAGPVKQSVATVVGLASDLDI
jgi:hypothetical protein